MADPGLAWRVEETCLNAWPALRQVLCCGWVLRFSDGLSRRANSANALSAASGNIDRLVAVCERLYPRQYQPAIFRLLSIADPKIDTRLADLGYTREGESAVLYGDIAGIAAADDPAVRLFAHPTRKWFAAMASLQGYGSAEARTYRRIVRQIAIPAAFALLTAEGAPAALAYGAIHNDLLNYVSVVADPQRRRRGFARRVVMGLAAWAKREGAVGACLEVEAGNVPALTLYAGLGLGTELYRYHYRRQPGGSEVCGKKVSVSRAILTRGCI